MNVLVVGEGPLAEATRKACGRHFPYRGDADVLWVCSDVPFWQLEAAIIVISWPAPPGTMKRFEQTYPHLTFAYSPENVRLAHAEQDFLNQDRIICGVRKPDPRLDALFVPFTDNLLYTSIETAEMVKHALNGFLALSVAYANELGELCKKTGADMNHVTHALRTDPRIGMRAYLDAGLPYGSHLEREINNLLSIHETPLISAAKRSNDEAKGR
jgi:UDPglucose 6-dehydrogenase